LELALHHALRVEEVDAEQRHFHQDQIDAVIGDEGLVYYGDTVVIRMDKLGRPSSPPMIDEGRGGQTP
jgi:hypothetical protein